MGHGIYGPFFPGLLTLQQEMTNRISSTEKRPVLIRVPSAMYEDILNLSAAATLLQRRSISVPNTVLDLLAEALANRRVNTSRSG